MLGDDPSDDVNDYLKTDDGIYVNRIDSDNDDVKTDYDNDNFEVPANYAGQLGPSSHGSEAVPVYLNISILALPRIDTILLQFTADYYVNLRWYQVYQDNLYSYLSCTRYDGRLVFKDLNSNSLLNGVQTSALRHLWTPQLAFVNALGPYQTVVDDISVCTIVLEENPTNNDLTNSLECKSRQNLPTIEHC